MASPAKRRKTKDDSKSSPASSRSLDYFFGKQNQSVPVRRPEAVGSAKGVSNDTSNLTDEQLARKLQDEWDQEAAGHSTELPNSQNGSSIPAAATIAENLALSENSGIALKTQTASHAEDFPRSNDVGQVNELSESAFPTGIFSQTNMKTTLTLQSTTSAEDQISSTVPFDESPLTFDPDKYIPDLQKHWSAESGDASYSLLTRCFVLVNSTQSRIKIVDTLVNLLRTIIEGDPSSLLPTVRIRTLSFITLVACAANYCLIYTNYNLLLILLSMFAHQVYPTDFCA